jgi:hypothetical protein
MTSYQTYKEFEDFVAALFTAEGFEVAREIQLSPQARADLMISSSNGKTAVIEVRLFQTKIISASNLLQIAAQVELYQRLAQATKAMIVVSGEVPQEVREALKKLTEAIIYDIGTLAFLVLKHPRLLEQFEAITRQSLPFSEAFEPKPSEANITHDLSETRPTTIRRTLEIKTEKGRILCEEIKATKSGRVHAKQFEAKIIDALKYIFEEDLTAWAPQKATDNKISYYDVIARVASKHDFWNAVATQFRSRYIVFEFKNYLGKIKQGQIYTTEKYLFGTALRSTAIVISRKGGDPNALAACRGALRENGKLIVNLDLNDLCSMLHRRDRGEDHNSVLADRVDEMLMSLER